MRRHLSTAALVTVVLAGGCTPSGTNNTAPSTLLPSTSTTPRTSATTQPPSPGAPCTAPMVVYDTVRGEGAAGTAYFTYTFHNGGGVSCTVAGYPELTYVDSHGATASVPVRHDSTGGLLTLAPGDAVQFVAHHLNGLDGLGPSAPECAHPAMYEHMSVALPGGSVRLGANGTMSVQCGDITVGPWSRPGP